MPVTINGNTGIVSPGVDSTNLVLDGSTSGSITLLAPAVAGSNTQTLVAATGTLTPLIADTAKSATSTSVDFTGIPSWVKRITVMLRGVSTNGVSPLIVQLGSGSFVATGYTGYGANFSSGGIAGAAQTVGIPAINVVVAANTYSGVITIATLGSNIWVGSSVLGSNTSAGGLGGGEISLSGILDRVRITTVNGTDTFDAGTINILYE